MKTRAVGRNALPMKSQSYLDFALWRSYLSIIARKEPAKLYYYLLLAPNDDKQEAREEDH